jgi:hypothetical protein
MWFHAILGYLRSTACNSARAATRRPTPCPRPTAGPGRRLRLGLEPFEERALLSGYTVDRLGDAGTGTGLTGDLRYCITQANSSAGDNTITFGVTGTINLTSALPALTTNLAIQGPGAASLTVQRSTAVGTPFFGIFSVSSGATVGLSGLTIAGGYAYYNGGGILNAGTLTVSNSTLSNNTASNGVNGGDGGGIYNTGTLTLNDSTLSDDMAVAAGPAFGFHGGGGIYNDGTLTLSNSTLSGNSATGDTGIICYTFGGGIYNRGTLTLTNSSLSGNSATNSFNYGVSYGGGIYNDGTLTLSNSTLSGNTATNACGGIYNGGTLHARNTIIAGNTAPTTPDLYGNLGSQGHNVIGNDSGASGFLASDLRNVNPRLGPLQDNGGPTQTMALLAGSPALDAGDPAQLGVADQRGVLRSGGVNIGAYQASATAFLVTAPALATAGTAFDLTVQAVDPFRQPAVGYTGTVHFSSTDGQATLPGDYTFTGGDAGLHTFTGGVTLKTAGRQTVTAADTATGSTSAGNASVTVNPAAADHLVFLQQPTDTAAGQTMSPVIVEIVDAFGNVEISDNTDMVTLSIGTNPSGGTLSGTLSVTVVHGVATFSTLSIDVAGLGYTLHAASGGGLPDLDSNPFNITM